MDAHSENLRNKRLHEALASLPEIHRQVLVLRYMAGLKSKEIAETLRVSPNTINQRLMRARAKLRTGLNEEMVSMMPTAFAERKIIPGIYHPRSGVNQRREDSNVASQVRAAFGVIRCGRGNSPDLEFEPSVQPASSAA